MWVYDLWAKSNLFCDYNTVCLSRHTHAQEQAQAHTTYTYTFWKFGARDEIVEQLCHILLRTSFLWLFFSFFSEKVERGVFHTHVRLISREHGYGINKKCQFNGSKFIEDEEYGEMAMRGWKKINWNLFVDHTIRWLRNRKRIYVYFITLKHW